MSDKQEIPAFPTGDHPESQLYANPGMSLRDYFAAKAIVKIAPSFGEIGELATAGNEVDEILSTAAKYAYEIADRMLAARST